MARDDEDAARQDFEFVDRDDDRRRDDMVDADYDDDFPPLADDSGDGEPDPGYAAFAGDLEDPLADWPSPEASLEDLPEVRRRTAGAGPARASEAGDADDWLPEDDPPRDGAYSLAGAALADEGEDDRIALTDGDDHRATTAWSDSDEDFTTGEDLPAPPQRERAAASTDLPDPPAASAAGDIDLPDPPPADPVVDEDPPAVTAIDAAPPDDDREAAFDLMPGPEDDFVDDFLNDLDEPDDDFVEELGDSERIERGVLSMADEVDDGAAKGDGPDLALPMGAAAAAAPARQRSSVERLGDDGGAPRAAPPAPADDAGRGLPWAMIAVVALALVLLAAGGYGVVQQRSGLQAQIRELQAQLATAVSPEEAQAEREQQRQMALENESLAAELEALAAENTALEEQIAAMEAQLGERREAEAEAETLAKAERTAAAAREAERAAAQRATERRSAPAAGQWFVNFGSYAQREVADRWASRLDTGEGEVVVQSASAAGKTLYRVRVVGLASQDNAERVARSLERQYQLPRLWVGKSDQ